MISRGRTTLPPTDSDLLPKAGGSQSDGDDAFNGMILVQNGFDELQRLVPTP